MLRHLRPVLARCTLISLACVAVVPAMAAPAGGMFRGPKITGPKIITAPRFVPQAQRQFGLRREMPQRHPFGQHRFRGVEPFGNGNELVGVPVPVPVGGDAAAPEDRRDFSYENGPIAGPFPNPGPQIIILPDQPRARALRARLHRIEPRYTASFRHFCTRLP